MAKGKGEGPKASADKKGRGKKKVSAAKATGAKKKASKKGGAGIARAAGAQLLNFEAEKIVRDSIRRTVGFDNPIPVGSPMNEVGIVDPSAIVALNDTIVTSDVGVKSLGFEIGANDLDIKLSTKVSELRNQVQEKAHK